MKQTAVRIFRRIKVRTRIAVLLAFLLLVSSLCTIGAISLYIRGTVQDNMYDYLLSAQKKAADGIELFLDEVIMLSLRLRTNQDLYKTVLSRDMTREEREVKVAEIFDSIFSGNESGSVAGVGLMTKDGNYYTSLQDGLQMPPVPAEMLTKIQDTVFYVCQDPVEDHLKNRYIPVGVTCSTYYTGQSIGGLVLYVKETALHDIYGDMLTDMGYSYIVNEQNQSYFAAEAGIPEAVAEHQMSLNPKTYPYVGVEKLDGDKSVLAVQQLSRRMQSIGFNWQIVSVVPYSRLFSAEARMQQTLLLLGIGMFGVAMMIAFNLSNRLTAPLKRLRRKLTELGEGKLNSLIEGEAKDEIWELENSYNDMVVRINELIQKNIEEKEQERLMEFTALQAQINPHFLYNTLDALGWIARIKQQDEIERMVLELANFFRLSLHKGDRFITIEDEIHLVKSFVTIEQMRNPEKFDIEYKVDPALSQVMIPKIILQPVVENAIKHGVYELRRKGHIAVRVYREDGDIFMEVEDDGKGFDASHTQYQEYDSLKHSGYGLKNVAERIQLEYGADYGVHVQSEPGRTKVQLKLRLRSVET